MLGKRLAEARKKAGLDQVDLAVALGDRYDQPMISRVESGNRTLRLDGLVKAAQELKVSIDYLLGLTDDPTPAVQLSEQARTVVPMTRYAKPVFISYARAAAGPDEPVFDETEPTEVRYAFHKSVLPAWAREKSLLCIEAVGDSMTPTLSEGDLILLDRSQTELVNGQMFVIRTGDGLVVKRLKRVGRTWRLVSDNPAYPPRSVSKDDRVLGRVAWSGPQPNG